MLKVDPALLTKQLELEKEMLDNGLHRHMKGQTAAIQNDRESFTDYGNYLVRFNLQPVSQAINSFLLAPPSRAKPRSINLLRSLKLEAGKIAFIALRTLLDTISKTQTLTALSERVGRAIEFEYQLAFFQSDNPKGFKDAIKYINSHTSNLPSYNIIHAMARKHKMILPAWGVADKVHLGSKLIEIIRDCTNLINIVKSYNNRRKNYEYAIMLTPECSAWITDYKNNPFFTPYYMPMVLPPRAWVSPFNGGYYRPENKLSLVKHVPYNFLVELANRPEQLQNIYSAINSIQETGYIVNKKVLEVMEKVWTMGRPIAGLPACTPTELPPCPICGQQIDKDKNPSHFCKYTEETKQLWGKWRHQARLVYRSNLENFSKRIAIAKTLWLGNKYKDFDVFYFPHNLDFRGRVYSIVPFLNPQGPDYSKALLKFHISKPINSPEAENWLYIHGANCYGMDKVTYEERIKWVKEHENMIRSTACTPMELLDWWSNADDPWLFLAFCFEFHAYKLAMERNETFYSNLPVAMDGSCNGLQIFSLLVKDKQGAKAVNVAKSDTPQDIYQIVADRVMIEVKGVLRDEETPDHIRAGISDLLKIGINRKLTKRQVMVLPYGGTYDACRRYTLEYLRQQMGKDEFKDLKIFKSDLFEFGTFLANIIWKQMAIVITSSRNVMKYLRQLAYLTVKTDLPIIWTTPLGFKVFQAYPDRKLHRVKLLLGQSVIALRINCDIPNKLDKNKQKTAIAPNFVHSLDATALMWTVNLCAQNNIKSLMMIHDCYCTHAHDAGYLAYYLREAYYNMFKDGDVLDKFTNEIVQLFKLKPKDLPQKVPLGNLNVGEVLESKFFFS